MVERSSHTRQVVGSSPTPDTIDIYKIYGTLASKQKRSNSGPFYVLRNMKKRKTNLWSWTTVILVIIAISALLIVPTFKEEIPNRTPTKSDGSTAAVVDESVVEESQVPDKAKEEDSERTLITVKISGMQVGFSEEPMNSPPSE